VDLDTFLAANQPTWDRLAKLTQRAERSAGRLTPSELEELVRLYQRVSSHLSYARTYLGDPSLIARLTGLVAAAGAVVYGTRAKTWRTVGRFFTTTFPAAVYHARWFMAVSALLLLVPTAVVGIWLGNSDRALNAAAPEALREAYVEEDFEEYYSSRPAGEFAAQVTTNNIQVSIYAFAGGIAFCVLSAFILVFNGANLGFALGLFIAAGQQPRFWGLIIPHGLLELTAVIIAGGAGLRLGWTLIDPGDRPRSAALVQEGRRAVSIVIGLFLVFIVAGLIEGFVTGSGMPTPVRVTTGVLVEIGFLAYIWTQGRAALARGLTGAIGEEDAGWIVTASRAT
jgi:uncharacterized membrane protein SpoIIM required for sporulation